MISETTARSNTNECKVLYEDNHLIIAVKPAGVLSQSDGSGKPDMLTILKEYLRVKYEKPGNVFLGLVHRLDLPVSGVMVFARTSKAAARLSAQIRERRFLKRYLAVVSGQMDPETGKLVNKLTKNEGNIVAEDTSGKESILEYKQIAYNKITGNSLVDILLETGRTHQIRVQFALAGHPLKGDLKYGKKVVDTSRSFSEPALFSYYIGFAHPVTGEPKEFSYYPVNKIFTEEFDDLTGIIDKIMERR